MIDGRRVGVRTELRGSRAYSRWARRDRSRHRKERQQKAEQLSAHKRPLRSLAIAGSVHQGVKKSLVFGLMSGKLELVAILRQTEVLSDTIPGPEVQGLALGGKFQAYSLTFLLSRINGDCACPRP
jgi:hypothetical protein